MTFLGITISSEGMSPNKTKRSEFLSTLKTPKTFKQIRRFIGFVKYFQSFSPEMVEKLLPFYRLLRSENELTLTKERLECIDNMRNVLEQACNLSLRHPEANEQYVILTDASFFAAGYVLMIKDYLTDQSGKTFKTYVPDSFGSKVFTPTN